MPSVSKAAAAALSGSPPQTEKPTHYRYLKEFRTEQCPLFSQHKCAQHRPFTCFHWHFLNQRRRRPLRRRDGTFNYSPDVYCSKYNEATGVCPDGDESLLGVLYPLWAPPPVPAPVGAPTVHPFLARWFSHVPWEPAGSADPRASSTPAGGTTWATGLLGDFDACGSQSRECVKGVWWTLLGFRCPYLHRTTGDTERKYHLRYYKTGTCIHETDARGHCVKNGLHCAFAHGPLDLRPPVCDVRELQAQEALQNGQLGGGEGVPDLQPGVLASQAMIEKILSEDPRWQALLPVALLRHRVAHFSDANFVLGSYKTEQCPKPPRLCRQGYACPHYHNSRDRRRNPRRFQYRSTPCPSVKHGDEWGEPSRCDGGDGCQYCHSRTEQQFHPEGPVGSPVSGAFSVFSHAGLVADPSLWYPAEWSWHHVGHSRTINPEGDKPSRLGPAPENIKRGNDFACDGRADAAGMAPHVCVFPIYKSTKCNDMRQTGYCPRGPFCAFAHVEKSLGMVNEWGCHDLHLTSPSSTGSGQPGNAKRRDSPAEGGPRGSEQDSKQGVRAHGVYVFEQNHLAVFAAVHPPAPSVSSSVASSLASSAGSGSSSPTALPAPPARALPLGPASSTVEAVLALEPTPSSPTSSAVQGVAGELGMGSGGQGCWSHVVGALAAVPAWTHSGDLEWDPSTIRTRVNVGGGPAARPAMTLAREPQLLVVGGCPTRNCSGPAASPQQLLDDAGQGGRGERDSSQRPLRPQTTHRQDTRPVPS
ncbi:unkempt-like (Drosophila), isoform CRA_b [Homo sapiens]|uniref:Isoform 6 of Putative E3 ubiquitin-protein ligase UNKL n=1 Tax=Homo sapiens TaxID=9606 RepID=Q9H9P5-6|nr:Ce protein similar to Dm Cys3His finger protein [Homo sapiens]EAW85660.1 unkempt-like (Drosophila), isoform CRA_b [Homo sapiens]